MATNVKKTKKKPDMRLEFANSEFADSFALTLLTTFPNCDFIVQDNIIILWASKKSLTSIKEMSGYNCFQRNKISVYSPC